MRYAIVNYPIPEEILNSGVIAQNNKTARINNSKDKCVVNYNDGFHHIFRGYPTLPGDELLDYLDKNPKEWDSEFIQNIVHIENTQKTYAIADNMTDDDRVLYTKIHGQKAESVAAGESHMFSFQNPYPEIYFQGAEIMQDIIGVSDFDIFVPVPGHPDGGVVAEKYGFDVNMGTIKYIRESKYAAKIPQGIMIRCSYKNDTTVDQEVGVNFLLHEIRDQQ